MGRKVFIGVMLAVVVFAMMVPAAMAQQQGQRGQGGGQFTPPTPESRVEQIEAASVKLTADQRAQLIKVFSETTGGQAGGRGMAGGMMGVGGQLPEAVQKVLTADQVKQYNTYTMRQSVDRQMELIGQTVTGLTADQRTKMAPIIEKQINDQNALMTSMMSQGQNMDIEALQIRQNRIREATANALQGVLTPAQMTQYNSIQQGMGGMGGGAVRRGQQ
jgi:hypothetical protein